MQHLVCPVCTTAHLLFCVFCIVFHPAWTLTYTHIKGMTFVMHYGTILPVPFSIQTVVSPSPVSAAVCSAGHNGGWGGTHHLPRYGLPKDWSANGL